MIVVRSLILGSLVLALTGLDVEAGGKNAKMILGKWKMEKKDKFGGDKEIAITIVLEFSKAGKLAMSMKIGDPINKDFGSSEGTYKFLDDTTLETVMPPPGKKEAEKDKVKIETLTKETLVLSEEKKGKTEKMEFKRQK